MEDRQIRIHYDDLQAGMKLRVDKGFSCMHHGTKTVFEDNGHFYLECSEGKHYLDAQKDNEGKLVGLWVADDV